MTERSIFLAAIDIDDPHARAAFLEHACAGDADLRGGVDRLLGAHAADGTFLDRPAYGPGTTVGQPPPVAERAGATVGPYRLMEQIGEGGFGLVFVAEQAHPVRRKVALKLIKPGMDTREVIARFEQERQALALMDHPNIARVLDAGATEAGRPYFVMELVKGVPITDYCDQAQLSPRERLGLFVAVCQAVQHAHQKGVIHRDLKPSNVLVTLHDGAPVVKVIDFGVAKAVGQCLTERTVYTRYAQMIGTPLYISPEQAEMSGLDVDTRSDVYSLGVMLYELLTGSTPFDRQRFGRAAFDEIRRIIREEDPPKPSTRLTTLGQTLSAVSARRRTEPRKLPALVRGDLDWIVMKALEKDRTRRYETPAALAADLRRFLAEEPVEACPPSPAYRLKKLARKHRALLATAASFVALLLIAALVSTVLAAQAVRARRAAQRALGGERAAREEAESAKRRVEQAAERLAHATQLTGEGLDFYTRSNWQAAHDHFSRAMQVEPALDTPYVYRGALYTRLGLWREAAADYDRRFQLARSANADTWFDYLLLKVYGGDPAGYRNACQDMLRQHRSSADARSRYCVLRSCLLMPEPVGDPGELVRRAEALAAGASAPWHLALAARAHLRGGDPARAETRCREAITLGAGSPAGVHRVNYPPLAIALHEQGKTSEARDALAVADAAKDQWTAVMREGLVGTMPLEWSNWLEFLLLHREAATRLTGSPPAEDPRLAALRDRALVAVTHGDVFASMDAGREYLSRREWDRAAASFARVLDQLPPGFRGATPEMRFCVEMVQSPEVFDRLVGLRPASRHPWYARGRTHAAAREWGKAGADLRTSIDLIDPGASADAADVGPQIGRAVTAHELAALLLLGGDGGGYRALRESLLGEELAHDDIVLSCVSRACTLEPYPSVELSAAPLRMAESAVRIRPRAAWHLHALGIAQLRAGRRAEAVETLQRSLAVNEGWLGRGQNYAALALACHELGREPEARRWLERTKTWLNAVNRDAASWQFGFAASDYLSDWLCAQVLLREAEQSLAGERGS